MTKLPILLCIFKRPQTTARTFEAIRSARPPRLYVSADGPRDDEAGEADLCAEARRVATAVDWPCQVRTMFRDRNVGSREAIGGGISWFFENEEEGIILEEDCLPHPSFFPYCEELLARYRDDERVMCISGDNPIPISPDYPASYIFSAYSFTWGWATWRRAWHHNSFSRFRSVDKTPVLSAIDNDPIFIEHFRKLFEKTSTGEIDSWDYVWLFSVWSQSGLTCMPKVNLVSNIGFGDGGTYCLNPDDPRANLATHEIETPLVHPELVHRHWEFDQVVKLKIHSVRPPKKKPRKKIVAKFIRKAFKPA